MSFLNLTFQKHHFRNWEKELEQRKCGKEPSLGRALVRSFGRDYAVLAIWAVLEVGTGG